MHRPLMLPACFAISLILTGSALAQPAESSDDAKPAVSQAEEEFKKLNDQFGRLRQSLSSMRGFTDQEKPIITQFRDRVAEFTARWPHDSRGLAMELTLSQWLKDDDRVNAIFARLVDLNPDNFSLRETWAAGAIKANKFDQVLEILGGQTFDHAKHVRAAKALGDAYRATERYAEALAVYESIPADAQKNYPEVQGDLLMLMTNFKQYPELWTAEQELRSKQASLEQPLPQVELWTTRGRILLELYEEEAPDTVGNFVSLVESGYYNHIKFHRVIANFMAQMGDPRERVDSETKALSDGPGYTIVDEHVRPDARKHFSGVLSMANKGPNTGGSQFFLTVTATPWLDGKHTVFGRIVDGMDIVRDITQDDVCQLAKVVRKRDHEYKANKIIDSTGAIGQALNLPVDALSSEQGLPPKTPVITPAPEDPAASNKPDPQPETPATEPEAPKPQ